MIGGVLMKRTKRRKLKRGKHTPVFDDRKGACGMAAAVTRDNVPSAEPIEMVHKAARRMVQRGGGVKRGAGAGLTVEIDKSEDLSRHEFRRGEVPGIAVVFLPKNDKAAKDSVEEAISAEGARFVGWNKPVTRSNCLGKFARETEPEILHAVFALKKLGWWEKLWSVLVFLFLAMFGRVRLADWSDPVGVRAFKVRKAIERSFLLRRYGASSLEEVPKKDRVSQYPFLVSCSTYTVTYLVLGNSEKIFDYYPELRHRVTRYALIHVRYSTNTGPEWARCHPWDGILTQNGEVNTLRGNLRWWQSRDKAFCSESMRPILNLDRSDTGNLAEIVSLLAAEGMGEDEAIRLLVPPAHAGSPDHQKEGKEKVRAMYRYWETRLEPWEGPLAVIVINPNRCYRSFWDQVFGRVKQSGPRLSGIVDRSGLRPLVVEMSGKAVSYASEFGFTGIPLSAQTARMQVQRGQMVCYDVESDKLSSPEEVEAEFAARAPYERLLRATPLAPKPSVRKPGWNSKTLVRRLSKAGVHSDDCEEVLAPMALTGVEPHVSMGDDSQPWHLRPLNVLTSLFNVFLHAFAHVTRPSIDAVRQEDAFTMGVSIGPKGTPFRRTRTAQLVELDSPFLSGPEFDEVCGAFRTTVFACEFDTRSESGSLRRKALKIATEVVEAVRRGTTLAVLDDTPSADHMQFVPLALVVPLVHRQLAEAGLRSDCSIICRCVEARDAHEVGVLLSYGAEAVYPSLIEELLFTAPELLEPRPGKERNWDWSDEAGVLRWNNWRKANINALRLIMGRLGTTPMSSTIGAETFFPYGLDDDVMAEVFPGRKSRMGLMGWEEIETIYRNLHSRGEKAPDEYLRPENGASFKTPLLPISRTSNVEGEGRIPHSYSKRVISTLREFTHADNDSPDDVRRKYLRYCDEVHGRPPTTPRSFLEPNFGLEPVLDEAMVPTVRQLLADNMFLVPISLGAQPLQPWLTNVLGTEEAGAIAHTGEGGIPEELYGHPLAPRARQIASGGFGFRARNLADERAIILCVKMAQAAKTATGGVLDGKKVVLYVPKIRGTKPGRGAYSPANLLDINSIEDLQFFVRLLRLCNPHAAIEIKIVATEDFGPLVFTIADMLNRIGNPIPRDGETPRKNRIYIQGKGGSTGNAQLLSREHGAISWEEALREAVYVLAGSGLEGTVDLVVDGGFKTAWDVFVAGVYGAKAAGFGTAIMIADECVKCDVCQGGGCPTGQAAAATAGALIDKYVKRSDVERVIRFWQQTGLELQTLLRRAGVRTFDELKGRFDLLKVRERGGHYKKFTDRVRAHFVNYPRVDDPDVAAEHGIYRDSDLDNRVRNAAPEFFLTGTGEHTVDIGQLVPNHAPFGASLTSSIVRLLNSGHKFTGHLTVTSEGFAPQGFGALTSGPFTMIHTGVVSNFAWEGIEFGATGVVRQTPGNITDPHRSAIGLNCIGYRMQEGGRIFAAGSIGSYAAACNRGGLLVSDGCGSYLGFGMSTGTVVILGKIDGSACFAGMTGGTGFIYDPTGDFQGRYDKRVARADRLSAEHREEIEELRRVLEEHHRLSLSTTAGAILEKFDACIGDFWLVTCSTVVAEPVFTPTAETSAVVERYGLKHLTLVS